MNVDEVNIPVGGLFDEDDEHIIGASFHGEYGENLFHESAVDDSPVPIIDHYNQHMEGNGTPVWP